MKFNPNKIKGSFIITPEENSDSRGFFSRIYCKKEYQKKKLTSNIVQISNSLSLKKGTLRGMHYQKFPKSEIKIVRCISGSIFDVIVDLRKKSPSYLKWFGVKLSAKNRQMLYVPKGCAHGFLTLEDNCEIIYFTKNYYNPDFEKGIKYNDPKIMIKWPDKIKFISKKDNSWREL